MKINIKAKTAPKWLPIIVCVVLSALGIVYFAGYDTKWMTLLAGFGIIALLATGDLKRLKNAPSLLLIGYVLFSWLTIFWAMSGKFHLREWSKIFVALFFFLFIVLRKNPDRSFVRRVTGIIAGMSAIYAFMSVEAAATGICKAFLQEKLPSLLGAQMVFNASRLYGIFGNSNVEASIYAIGIIFSIALLCGSEKKWQRILFAVTLSFNAFVFLLVFSMGAIVCFAAAIIVYLIVAGKGRGAALVRMLGGALPTVVFVFLATRFFNREGAEVFAVLLMLGSAAVSVALEMLTAPRLSAAFGEHHKLVLGLIVAILLLAGGYVATATQLIGPYTFGDELNRSLFLDAGAHTLKVETDGDVNVRIYSQDRLQIMRSGGTTIYNGFPEGKVAFTVPEDAEIVFFRFSGEDGAVIHAAFVDGQQELPLHYKLLPDFIANRIQNLTVSNSQIQRRMYREDGMKLFRLAPIAGNGAGAFETGITAVQDYPYETKYVHNHYIQILLEDGVIGFALFATSLLAMIAVLWKNRKLIEESEFHWIYPALCAEFVMNGAQMCWDVSMSVIVFTCMTYVVYGLIIGICAEPIGKQEDVSANSGTGKKKKAITKNTDSALVRVGCMFLPAALLLTLCGNMNAESLVSREGISRDMFFSNLEKAAKFDIYERNDAMLSYVVYAAQRESDCYIDRANEYARRLSKVQSNTIPQYLVAYYLQTQQYEAAIDEAMLGATYSASDAETWNASVSLLKQAFVDSGANSPLLTDGETLLPKLMAYYNQLQAYNARALKEVELNEESQAFFDKVLAISDCLGDAERFIGILLTE